MKIRNKLYISAGISIVSVVILSSLVLVTSGRVAEENEKHQLLTDVYGSVSELDIVTYDYLLHREERMEQQWYLKHDSLGEILDGLAEEEGLLPIHADYATLGNSFSQIIANYEERQTYIREGASQEKIDAAIELEERLVAQLLITSHSVITDASRLVEEAQAEVMAAQRLAVISTLILMIIMAITITISSLFVARSISKPLTRLADYSRRVGEGEYTADIEIKGKDEIASVASDVKSMVGQLQKHREHLEELVDERTKELVDAQERLLESERLATLGQFSGNISHELRNSLGVIGSSAYYLKTKLKDADKKVHEHLTRIKASVGNSTTTIESLLNLTRMEKLQLTKIDLTAITIDAITTSKIPATVKVTQDFPKKKIPVNADREQLRMAFKNIIKNAREAMGGKGTLTVTVGRTADGQAEVSFADTGTGIVMEDLEKVFQPLFSRKAKSVGFGLSIAKMVVDKHGGTIEAKSEPGKGANIIIQLPSYTDTDKEA